MTLGRHSALKMTYSPFLDRAGIKGERAIVAQMADDIRIWNTNAGCVVESDMELVGWTRAQLDRYGQAAARVARAQAERVV